MLTVYVPIQELTKAMFLKFIPLQYHDTLGGVCIKNIFFISSLLLITANYLKCYFKVLIGHNAWKNSRLRKTKLSDFLLFLWHTIVIHDCKIKFIIYI